MKLIDKGNNLEYDLEKTEQFCPNCGKQEVWAEKGEGDYYQGPSHYCQACRHGFTIPSLYELRSNQTFEP